jgi:uncharacterized metal-binding protein
MNHIHRQAALSLLKSGHSVTAATVQGGWRGRPDAPRRGVRKLAGSLCAPRCAAVVVGPRFVRTTTSLSLEYHGGHMSPSPSARCRPECSSRVREAIATCQEMLCARHCGHIWRRCLRWILPWVYDDGWGRNRHALTALGRRQTAVSSPFLASLNTRGQPCAPPARRAAAARRACSG